MALPITSITFLDGIMTVLHSNGQQDDWNLAYVVGPVSTIIAPTPTSNVAGEVVSTTRPGLQAASMVLQYPGEELPRAVVIDVRDVEDPIYATAQDLADDITSNIPVGGGGGGTTTSVTSVVGPGLSVIETGAGTANVELKRIVAGVGIGVYADTGGLRIENEGSVGPIDTRIGSLIQFDAYAIYNWAAPLDTPITYDLSGALDTVEVYALFNHSALPTFPVGTVVLGAWDNGGTNLVKFAKNGATIVATIQSNALSSPLGTSVILTPAATITNASTTGILITGISHVLPANSKWAVEGMLNIANFVKFGLSFTNTATPFIVVKGRGTSNTNVGTNDTLTSGNGYNSVGGLFFSGTTSTLGWAEFGGTILVGGSNSTFGILFSAYTNGVTASIYNGGYIKLNRIS